MATKISQILQPEFIKLSVESKQRTQGIHEVASLLMPNTSVSNFQGFYEELLARERVETTCLGNGVAFPHARTDHVSNMVLAAGRSKEGIWFENCNQNVNFLFVIGTPKRMVTDYLTIVGALARILRDADVRQTLADAKSAEEFRKLLATAESKL